MKKKTLVCLKFEDSRHSFGTTRIVSERQMAEVGLALETCGTNVFVPRIPFVSLIKEKYKVSVLLKNYMRIYIIDRLTNASFNKFEKT